MSRSTVKDLKEREPVDQIFLASQKQLRSNRQGNLYLQVVLSDRSGSIDARLWNANEDIARRFENGDYVQVKGTTHVHQGGLQIIAQQIQKAAEDEVDEEGFRRVTRQQIDELSDRMTEILRSVTDPDLAELVESYLTDSGFMYRFQNAPAGVKNHHAYEGGLLEHVVQLLELCSRVGELYESLDRDLLLMGAFLHDSGKIDELTSERSLAYTDEGQLLGHITLGMRLLDAKISETSARTGTRFPEETAIRLQHMIASHHGALEFGSPTLPMTVEAIALHFLDNLDAKIHHFENLIREDVNVDSSWTQYHPGIGRKLYKGPPESVATQSREQSDQEA